MNPFKVLLCQSVTFYRIAGEENCTHWDYIHTSGATRYNSKELPFLDLKRHSQKKRFFVRKEIFRLETWNLSHFHGSFMKDVKFYQDCQIILLSLLFRFFYLSSVLLIFYMIFITCFIRATTIENYVILIAKIMAKLNLLIICYWHKLLLPLHHWVMIFALFF